MADWFVDDAATDNTGTGAWNDPLKYLWLTSTEVGIMTNTTLGGGSSSVAAGDTVYVLDNHSEDHGSAALTLTNNGTSASPIKIINVASFNSGSPNTLGTARGCFVGHTAAASTRDLSLKPGLDIYGFDFAAGDNMNTNSFADNTVLTLRSSKLGVLRSGFDFLFGPTSLNARIVGLDLWLGTVGAGEVVVTGGLFLELHGGKISSGFTGTYIFQIGTNGGRILADSFDMSAASATTLLGGGNDEVCSVDFYNSKIPSGITLSNTPNSGCEYKFMGCSNGVNDDMTHYAQNAGNVVDETTIVRTGGSATALLMQPNTNVSSSNELKTVEIAVNADFSSSKTIDVYIGNNTRDLNDTEIRMGVAVPTNATGGSTYSENTGANWLVSATNHTDDTGSTWGGAGLTYMQKMSITVGGASAGRSGDAVITIFLSVDLDVYVDALPVVT
jgi:hypothetical protein